MSAREPGSPVRDGPGDAPSSELDVQVVPRASRSRIVGPHDGRLKIQLAAPPVDGAANEALVGLLAETLEVPRGAVGDAVTLQLIGFTLFTEGRLITEDYWSASVLAQRASVPVVDAPHPGGDDA